MAFSRTIGNLRAKVNLFNDWSADLGEDNAPSAFVCFQIEARLTKFWFTKLHFTTQKG